MDDLVCEFVAETREMLEQAGETLVAWEANPRDAALLDEVFRFVHTVKGSCGFLNLPRIGGLAHAGESVLAAVRGGERQVDGPMVGAMLALIDHIAVLVEALENGAAVPPEQGDERLIAAFDEGLVTPAVPSTKVAKPTNAIRVQVELLDAVMTHVSDLVLARNEVARHLRHLDVGSPTQVAFDRFSNTLGELRDAVARTRMQPIARLFRALPRLARDTAAELGKSVDLIVEGDDVEIDREMVEMLRDPLTHIVRNAIDHGLETPQGRIAAGKSKTGRLIVNARQTGNQVTIIISDDGRGIEIERLVERALSAGVLSVGAAASIAPDKAAQLVFEAGLSTADKVTEISGRGVGMDVVRANIERLGGTIALDNAPGAGLTITLRLPLTLSILSALTIQVGPHRFALPRAAIHEVVAIAGEAVRYEAIGDGHLAVVRGAMVPVIPFAEMLETDQSDPALLIIVDAAGTRYALPVDSALEHEELVVRPLAPPVAALGIFAGQSLPDDGRPVLLLDPTGLAARAGIERTAVLQSIPKAPTAIERRETVILFDGLDGAKRAIRTSDVERLDDVQVDAFTSVGPNAFVTLDARLCRAIVDGPLPGQGMVAMLRLRVGSELVGRPVAAIHDLHSLGEIAHIDGGEDTEGMILIDGSAVSLMRGDRVRDETRHAA